MKNTKIFILIGLIFILGGCSEASEGFYSKEDIDNFVINLDECIEGNCNLKDNIIYVKSGKVENTSKPSTEITYKLKGTDILFTANSLCISDNWYSKDCRYGITTNYYYDVIKYLNSQFEKETNISSEYAHTYHESCIYHLYYSSDDPPIMCSNGVKYHLNILNKEDAFLIANYLTKYIDYLNNFKNKVDFNFLSKNYEIGITIKDIDSICYEEFYIDLDDNGKYYIYYLKWNNSEFEKITNFNLENLFIELVETHANKFD